MNKFTVKKPDGTEVVMDRDGLVIGYNQGNIDASWPAKPVGASEWERVGILIGVESAISSEGSTSPSAVSGGSITTVLFRRYQDAYLVARATAAIGQTVKTIGIVLGIVVALGALIFASQTQGTESAGLLIGGLLLGAIVGIPLYILGILVAAQGQVLKATLDAAVHTSPFLEKQDMAKIMSI